MIPKYAYMQEVVNRMQVSEDEILSRSRLRRVKQARLVLWTAMRLDGYSYPAIGRFTNRDHSTVMHLIKSSPEAFRKKGEQIYNWLANQVEIPEEVEEKIIKVPNYKQNKIEEIQQVIRKS